MGVKRAGQGTGFLGDSQSSWLPVCVTRDGGGGRCYWKATGQSPQQVGNLHTLHSSEQLGYCGHLEKKAEDIATDPSPYTTSGYCHRTSVGPSAGTERGQRSKAETMMGHR